MKTFRQLIFEDKARFIRKNKNLSPQEQDEIIAFFDSHNHSEKKFTQKYGTRGFVTFKYEEFTEWIEQSSDTNSQQKKKAKKMRHRGIKGMKEGEDYVHVKTSNPYFTCYIPLNYKANQVIFSSHIGNCRHDGCIGSSQAEKFYRLEAIKNEFVPVVVVGENSKDTVMIKPDNKSWEAWDSGNNKYSNNNKPFVNREIIDGFSIRKELITTKLAALYDWVRDNWRKGDKGKIYIEEYEYIEIEYGWDMIIYDIDEYILNIKYAYDDILFRMERLAKDTLTKYKDLYDSNPLEYKNEYQNLQKLVDNKDFLRVIINNREPKDYWMEDIEWAVETTDIPIDEEEYISSRVSIDITNAVNRDYQEYFDFVEEYTDIRRIYPVLIELQSILNELVLTPETTVKAEDILGKVGLKHPKKYNLEIDFY